jgi:4-hydroxy-3-methylbut-2-enyl diphosphate reductase
VNAIRSAENALDGRETLYCLGDIVHNSLEVERLRKLGLRTINHEELSSLRNRKVLLRAHGEPPSTYLTALQNNIRIIDATCPVVLRLQQKIHNCYKKHSASAQIIIYGKEGHAEVNGLVGQTEGTAIVVESVVDLDKIDFSRDISMFSQTTNSIEGFQTMVETIRKRLHEGVTFAWYDTICRQVSNRMPGIKLFAMTHDVVYFVAGSKSSNGRILYNECRKANPRSFFISHPDEVGDLLPEDALHIGVCGATSTPKWLMEKVAMRIREIYWIKEKAEIDKSFANLSSFIFEQSTRDYHIYNHVDAPEENTWMPGSIENILYHKNWIDAVQWHLEDLIRDPDINPEEALKLKRRIDRSNQERTDIVESIDDYFMQLYGKCVPLPDAGINTESPAWAIDRFSILVLKIYHMNEETVRIDADEAHKTACLGKLVTLFEQKNDLGLAIDALISDISEGRKYMKTYKQMKMYNDPELNPILRGKNG